MEFKNKKISINDIKIKKILIDDVINFNKVIKTLIDEKSEHFVKSYDLLDSSINGVYIGYYQDNLEQLSEIWYRLVKNHPFSNGNKRTALYTIKFTIIYNVVNHYLNKGNYKEKIIKKNYFKNMLKKFFYDVWEQDYYLSLEIAQSKNNDLEKEKIIKKINENIIKTFDSIIYSIV